MLIPRFKIQQKQEQHQSFLHKKENTKIPFRNRITLSINNV